MNIRLAIRRSLRDRNGATSIEYGLIAALIAVVVFTGIGMTGASTDGLYTKVETAFNTYIK